MSRERGRPGRDFLIPAVIAGAGALLVAMVVLLALTLAELRSSQNHIASTDRKMARLTHLVVPAAEQAGPIARNAGTLVDAATPVVRSIDRAMPALRTITSVLVPALPRVPAVLSSGQELISEAIPAVRAVAASNLGPTLAEARQVLGQIPIQQLDAAIAQAVTLLDDAAEQRLPERAAEAADLLEEVLAVQHHLVTLQERSVHVQTTSLEIQRRTLSHTRSIDNRLGGQLPPLSRTRP